MNPNRKAREAALQALFQREFNPELNAEQLFENFANNFELDRLILKRAQHLALGVTQNIEKLNSLIEKYSNNWRVDRMASTDLIILQIATFELCLDEGMETPPKLCINDFVDIAKKYSSQESKNFINGILDEVYHKELGGA